MVEFTEVWTDYLWLFCLSITIIGILYSILVSYTILRFAPKTSVKSYPSPPITILKPLHGAEAELEKNLSSFCEQDYPGPIQILFGVSNPIDPALKTAKDIKLKYPKMDISLLCDQKIHGENKKISNIINMFKLRQHSLVVVSDSDIRVEKNYLKTIFASLEEEGVGLVSFFYRGLPLKGFWSQMTACHIDHHFFPSALLGTKLGLTTPCFGSTIAIYSDLLKEIGGFENFASILADDYVLGDKVREKGLKISYPSQLVIHTCSEESFLEYFFQILRWGQTIRSINPYGYFGSLVTHPLPFALCATLLKPTNLISYLFLSIVLTTRMLIPLLMKSKFQAEGSSLALLPLGDLISFMAYILSFTPLKINWKGKKYHLHSSGKIKEI